MQDGPDINRSHTTLNAGLLLVTAILVVIAVTWSSFNEYSSWFSLLILLLLGIPHGAVDHLVDHSSKRKTAAAKAHFYLQYFLWMGVMGGVWYFSAGTAMIIFLFISAFHFGQSHWHTAALKRPFSYILYLSWGMLILSIVIYFNLQQCFDLINNIGWGFTSDWFNRSFWSFLLVISVSLVTILLIYVWTTRKIHAQLILPEVVFIILLWVLSVNTDALFAFAVYFGIWHSTKALILEYNFLNNLVKTPTHFIMKLVPYTLVSLVGLFSLYFIIKLYLPQVSIYMVFFVLVSILTVPHLFIMHPVYESDEPL